MLAVLLPALGKDLLDKLGRVTERVEPEELVELVGGHPDLLAHVRVVLPVPGIVGPDQLDQVG